MRYYLDCEFDGFEGPLISLALIREDGVSLYLIVEGYAAQVLWVQRHVIPFLHSIPENVVAQTLPQAQFGRKIEAFLETDARPVIVVDWPADIIHMCQCLMLEPGKMVAIPNLIFQMIRGLKTGLKDAIPHNAWWDAAALRDALEPEA